MENEFFVPLGINKDIWDFNRKMIFLDSFYECQLSKKEKSNLNYAILPYENRISSEQDALHFMNQLIHCFSLFLNDFHNVTFSFDFWKKLFCPWLENFIYNVFSKVEDFERLSAHYPNCKFYSSTEFKHFNKKFLKEYGGLFCNEEFNNYIYIYIGEKFFNFDISYFDFPITNSITPKPLQEIYQKKSFFERLKRITLKKIIIKIWRKISSLANKINSSLLKPELILWCTYFSGDASDYFRKKSHGKIRTLYDPFFNFKKVDCESEINEDARQKLFVTMNKYFEDYNIPLKQKVVLKLLSLCLPFFYLENFNKYLACAKDFFNKNKSVKLFFATCTYCRETQPFMLTYGQTIGKKVMTEQHGGNYGISCGIYNKEAYLNDALYSWGTWGNDVNDSDAEFYPAPAYRQFDLYDNKEKRNDYILFLGSSITYYKTCRDEYFAGSSNVHCYINSVIDFFKNIDRKALDSILVRNYWLDYGYHLDSMLDEAIPGIKLQGYLQKNYNEDADFIARNNSFQQTLLSCSLIITNEHETCFIEALYCEKPFIVLFNKLGYPLRDEEIPYFKMMEDVGLLFYDWKAAAEKVNEIHKDINSWWNDEERQRVVKIIRNRYSMSVKDIKKWWYDEFTYQLKKYKKDKRYELKNNSHISTSARLKGI